MDGAIANTTGNKGLHVHRRKKGYRARPASRPYRSFYRLLKLNGFVGPDRKNRKTLTATEMSLDQTTGGHRDRNNERAGLLLLNGDNSTRYAKLFAVEQSVGGLPPSRLE